jgi:hypothetical protein
MSPGILLSSGYIAGGTIAGIVCAILLVKYKDLAFGPERFPAFSNSGWVAVGAFGVLAVLLLIIGSRRNGEQTVH